MPRISLCSRKLKGESESTYHGLWRGWNAQKRQMYSGRKGIRGWTEDGGKGWLVWVMGCRFWGSGGMFSNQRSCMCTGLGIYWHPWNGTLLWEYCRVSEGYPDKGVFKKRNDRVWITRLRNRYTPFKDEGKNRQDKHVGEYAGCLNVLWLLKHILPPTASCVGIYPAVSASPKRTQVKKNTRITEKLCCHFPVVRAQSGRFPRIPWHSIAFFFFQGGGCVIL